MILELAGGVELEIEELMTICSAVADAKYSNKMGTSNAWGIIIVFMTFCLPLVFWMFAIIWYSIIIAIFKLDQIILWLNYIRKFISILETFKS